MDSSRGRVGVSSVPAPPHEREGVMGAQYSTTNVCSSSRTMSAAPSGSESDDFDDSRSDDVKTVDCWSFRPEAFK